jgi:anti-anti-sigma factor
MEKMKISKTIENNSLVIDVSGRLDSYTSPELAQFFENQLERSHRSVILDMANLDYISSAGLRLILNTSKLLKSKNETFALCRMQDHIREIFEISGFDTFLKIYPSLKEALLHSSASGNI